MATVLQRWDPLAELANMRATMDRLFDQRAGRVSPFRGGDAADTTRTLGIDVVEGANDYVITAAVPGVDPKDVEIGVDDDVLTIKGETRHEDEAKDEHFVRRELRYGTFHRQLRLPPTVEAEKAEARFENGMLKLTLPKKAEARARSFKITPTGVLEAGASEAA